MLMTHFLDEDFRVEYLEIPAEVHSEEYYVNMMIAWFGIRTRQNNDKTFDILS